MSSIITEPQPFAQEFASRGKTVIVIPARMASKRLPRKPLLDVNGIALVHWVYNLAKKTTADHVIVATPDREIGNYCQRNGLVWRPTREDHPTGTHRCAEILEQIDDKTPIQLVADWQCDEVHPYLVECVDELLRYDKDGIATLVSSVDAMCFGRDVVKVVFSNGKCHWFSREFLPLAGIHVGIYAYKPMILKRLARFAPSQYSVVEGLEQLTWIEEGFRIDALGVGPFDPKAINTQRDYDAFISELEEGTI